MRKMKKINGFLVVRFNDREKQGYPQLGNFGVIDAEQYTGDLDFDLDAFEYTDADLIEIAVEQARGLDAEEDFGEEPTTYTVIAETAAEAREVLDTTRDPQLSDIALDRRCYQEMAQVAEETGSAFLAGYVKIQIDAANLRSLVRTLRMGKSGDFLKTVLLEGGDIGADAVAAAGNSGSLQELYGPTPLQAAAEAGAEALRGGPLTDFEKLCDDAVGEYLAGAQFVPFGEAPLLGYLAARETEYTNIHILLMGRGAGLPADVIRSRLRNGYV